MLRVDAQGANTQAVFRYAARRPRSIGRLDRKNNHVVGECTPGPRGRYPVCFEHRVVYVAPSHGGPGMDRHCEMKDLPGTHWSIQVIEPCLTRVPWQFGRPTFQIDQVNSNTLANELANKFPSVAIMTARAFEGSNDLDTRPHVDTMAALTNKSRA